MSDVTRYRTIVADPPWKYERFLPGYSPAARFGWDYWGDESLGTAEMGGRDVA